MSLISHKSAKFTYCLSIITLVQYISSVSNPFDIDEADIPQTSRAQSQKRRLRAVGLLLWGLFVGGLVVVLVSDTSSLSGSQAVPIGTLSIGTAGVAIGLGFLALFMLQYLPSFLAQVLFGLLFMLALFVVLPPLVSVVLDNVSLFDGIPTETEQPVGDLLRELLS